MNLKKKKKKKKKKEINKFFAVVFSFEILYIYMYIVCIYFTKIQIVI